MKEGREDIEGSKEARMKEERKEGRKDGRKKGY